MNDTCRYVMIAGSFRFFGGYAIGYFLPGFFGKIYPEQNSLYSVLNSFVVSIGGFASSMTGGYISDKYEPVNYMTKAWVCM